MTREEAIQYLGKVEYLDANEKEAIDRAIEALQAEAVCREEVDTWKGYYNTAYMDGFMVKVEETIVHCNDCRHAEHREQMPKQVYCHRDKLSTHGVLHDDDDFCKYGERREE